MPEDESPQQFTRGEAYALVADAIARETAAANSRVAEVEAENVTLKNEKDVLETRATAAEEGKATAEQALVDFKAELETQKAMESKRSERLAAVAAVAPKLELSDERQTRIVAMAEDTFGEYVQGLKDVAGPVVVEKDAAGKEIPRQTAGLKGGSPDAKPAGTVTGLFAARYGATSTERSA